MAKGGMCGERGTCGKGGMHGRGCAWSGCGRGCVHGMGVCMAWGHTWQMGMCAGETATEAVGTHSCLVKCLPKNHIKLKKNGPRWKRVPSIPPPRSATTI